MRIRSLPRMAAAQQSAPPASAHEQALRACGPYPPMPGSKQLLHVCLPCSRASSTSTRHSPLGPAFGPASKTQASLQVTGQPSGLPSGHNSGSMSASRSQASLQGSLQVTTLAQCQPPGHRPAFKSQGSLQVTGQPQGLPQVCLQVTHHKSA